MKLDFGWEDLGTRCEELQQPSQFTLMLFEDASAETLIAFAGNEHLRVQSRPLQTGIPIFDVRPRPAPSYGSSRNYPSIYAGFVEDKMAEASGSRTHQ